MRQTVTAVRRAQEPAARVLPPQLAPFMRRELPSLTTEIITEIRRSIPAYARSIEGPYGQALRLGVHQNLTVFVARIAQPGGGQHRANHEACRKLGRYEAREGRSMDDLQAAYRIGGQVAWRRIMKIAPRHGISSTVMSRLAEALFSYMDELAEVSLEGYREERRRMVSAVDEQRKRLLRLILEGPAVPHSAIVESAAAAGWALPAEVTPVAVQGGVRYVRDVLDEDLLVGSDAGGPFLLVPGPVDDARQVMLKAAVPDHRIAVGLTVGLPQAADSLRWARRTLRLAAEGVVADDGSPVLCEDHLVTLALRSDPALIDQLTRRCLGALDGMTPGKRRRLTDTLRTWLVSRGTAAEMGERLDVHPQTVRYRMRTLERVLGEQLEDPDSRFEIEVVLRALALRDHHA